MEIDKITYDDLSIFNYEDEFSIFHKLDFTQTNGGKQELKRIFQHPLKSRKDITDMQEVVHFIFTALHNWPDIITNGTIIMIEEYLNSKVEVAGKSNGTAYVFNLMLYKTLKAGDFAFITYSLSHVVDFLQGCAQLVNHFLNETTPSKLKERLILIDKLISVAECDEMLRIDFRQRVSILKVMRYDHYVRTHFRHRLRELIELYHLLDAWHSMALAVKNHELSFPVFVTHTSPYLHIEGLYHILLPAPVQNNVLLNTERNFLFLTGANMAGKSTFIKAIGIAVFLAHLGMAVPAEKMYLSEFDGILTNIQVADNIFLGESYFYNEVQRIKSTITKVKDRKHWLILIDEMFKGTNIEDAKNCSIIVIKGLSQMQESIFILSTHLYEIAHDLAGYDNVLFQYFETLTEDGNFKFNYHLKEGISNDRLGYLILKQAGVIDLLKEIDQKQFP